MTGAGSGLGAAIAERFGLEGANVVLNYHGDRHRDAIDATGGHREVREPGNRRAGHEFTALMEVNYKAVFFACGLAVSRIRDNGRVLNLSSNSTAMHFPGYGLYDSTKGAVEQITRLLTLEVGGRGVTVNVVAPGPTDTPAFRTRPKDLVEHMTSLSPLNRIGRIEEVVNVMVFLASDEASWITGQNIRVNGGAP